MWSWVELIRSPKFRNSHTTQNWHNKDDFPLVLQSVKGVNNGLAERVVVEEKGGNMAACYPSDF
jgi:hypothetical protein